MGGLERQGYEVLHAAYDREGRLFSVHCDLLYQCDLDCAHCYLDHKATHNRSTAFWKDVFDQLGQLGVAALTLSGGEIFLRPDILELVAHARSQGFIVSLKTHGGRIGEVEAARLAELGVTEVQVSYYSPDPEVHERITRRAGSHEATLKAMKVMVAHGLDVVASCSATRINFEHLEATAAQCAELGVQFKSQDRLLDGQSGDTYPRDLALTEEQALSLARRSLDTGATCSSAVSDSWTSDQVCIAGHTSLYIDPEGRVTPCITWPQVLGDLTRGDRLADIWENNETLDGFRSFRNRDRQGCSSCESAPGCNYCPGSSYTEHGDPMRPATSVCHDAHAKSRADAHLAGRAEPTLPPGLQRGPVFPILTSDQVRAAR